MVSYFSCQNEYKENTHIIILRVIINKILLFLLQLLMKLIRSFVKKEEKTINKKAIASAKYVKLAQLE